MFPTLGPGEMLVLMLVAVLLFGKRLPEVGRSLGKGIVEFKKGLAGVEDDFDSNAASATTSLPAQQSASATSTTTEPTVPKFEPPPSASSTEPVAAAESSAS